MRRAVLLKSFLNDLLFMTVKFAVDLGSGRTTVACLSPLNDISQFKISWTKVQSCVVRVRTHSYFL